LIAAAAGLDFIFLCSAALRLQFSFFSKDDPQKFILEGFLRVVVEKYVHDENLLVQLLNKSAVRFSDCQHFFYDRSLRSWF